MPTPESWYEAAKGILGRENGRKVGFGAEYEVKRRDSAGNASEVTLYAVSLVSDPLPGYEARIINAKGVDDDWSDDELVST
jgi:hypothetical protein